MKKRILALALSIPLIFMFTIFSAVNIVSIILPIPVSAIRIVRDNGNSGARELVYSGDTGGYMLDVEVLPFNASNKTFTVDVVNINSNVDSDIVDYTNYTANDNSKNRINNDKNKTNINDDNDVNTDMELPIISVDERGQVTLNDVGRAMVYVTSNDGGYRDQIEIIVTARRAMSLDVLVLENNSNSVIIDVDENNGISVPCGSFNLKPVFYPAHCVENVVWRTSDESIAMIDSVSGELRLRRGGIVEVICETVAEPKITRSLQITAVSPIEAMLNDAVLIENDIERAGIVARSVVIEGAEVNAGESGINEHTEIVSKNARRVSLIIEALFDNPNLIFSSNANVEGFEFIMNENTDYNRIVGADLKVNVFTLNINFGIGDIERAEFKLAPNGYDYENESELVGFSVQFNEVVLSLITKYGKIEGRSASAYQYYGDSVDYAFRLSPASTEYTFTHRVITGDASVKTVQNGDRLSVLHEGERESVSARLEFIVLDGQGNKISDLSKFVDIGFYHEFSSISIDESSAFWGRAERMAVGERRYSDGALVNDNQAFTLTVSKHGEAINPSALSLKTTIIGTVKSTFRVSLLENENKTKGVLALGHFEESDDYVKLSVTENITQEALAYFNRKPSDILSASIGFRAVRNGVNIYTSSDLFSACNDGHEIILKNDIRLLEDRLVGGEVPIDIITSLLRKNMINTTYDFSYYLNNGKPCPQITHILEFKNNVYGNGKSIDASLIIMSRKLNEHNNPIVPVDNLQKYFSGPLQLIGIPNIASIWAQDHISYLVRTDNVVIDNVELIGVADSYLYSNNQMDISRLNNAGTVLEIMANASLINSRVRNGRNGVRVYGRENPFEQNAGAAPKLPIVRNTTPQTDGINAEKIRIYFKMENCVLSRVREYLLKQGVNIAYASDNSGSSAPDLPRISEGVYKYDKNREFETNEQFYTDYVLVDSTVKNCVFEQSGLFAIGIEAHFAGPMLNGDVSGIGELLGADKIAEYFVAANWRNMVATSYASVLRLEGDIRIYEWKNLTNIDSSSLIESNISLLNLNIASMIETVVSVEGYDNILFKDGAQTLVHGGIVMYGGGKNYSWLDTSKLIPAAKTAQYEYSININVLKNAQNPEHVTQGKALPYAAGFEDFRFYLYDCNGSRNPLWQTNKNYEF